MTFLCNQIAETARQPQHFHVWAPCPTAPHGRESLRMTEHDARALGMPSTAPRVEDARVLLPGIQAAPERIVVDNAATEAALALGDDLRVGRFLSALRLPHDTIWAEWNDAFRQKECHRIEGKPDCEFRSNGVARAGALITRTDGSGRRGHVRMAFSLAVDNDGYVYSGTVTARFDFDNPELWKQSMGGAIKPLSHTALALLGCVAFDVDPAAEHFHRAAGFTADEANKRFQQSLHETAKAWNFLIRVLVMVTARGGVERRETSAADLSRINRAREKRGKARLMETSTLVMHAAAPRVRYERAQGAPRNRTRDVTETTSEATEHGKRRRHPVIGHFFTRSNGIGWQPPHERGDESLGRMPPRTRTVVI